MNSKHKSSTYGRPTAVTESFPVSHGGADYADAFEIGRSPSDKRHAERWARDGFEKLPLKSRQTGMLAHRHLLGFRLGPWSSPDHIFGWHIAESLPDVLHLEAKGNIMDGHMIWRLKGDRLLMTTFVKYNKPRLAAVTWAFAGRIHRNSVPGLLRLAANVAD
ncbi:MAG: hypothetical protein ACRESW_04750 [Nevskiales bacterium]